jgi:hypothetical protein
LDRQGLHQDNHGMVGFLLSVTFACGLVVAVAHVVNRRFVAPVYDVVANLTAFACAVAASTMLRHWIPALLAALAVSCWCALAVRTMRAIRHDQPRIGNTPLPVEEPARLA